LLLAAVLLAAGCSKVDSERVPPENERVSETETPQAGKVLKAIDSGLPTKPVPTQPTAPCSGPELDEEAVKKIIAKERATRTDLPKAFSKSGWVVRRKRCHYVAIESHLPAMPEANHIFTLNRNGVIVDVTIGISTKNNLVCPEKVFSEAELTQIVKDARAEQTDLPPPFPKLTTRVDRQGCSYYYFEYRDPKSRGDYQVFIVDALGELMSFQRSKPY
jgi:DNA-directed RNA polymerase subunit H (RpoH/RPB5)